MYMTAVSIGVLALTTATARPGRIIDDDLRTIAEASEFEATATSDDVLDLAGRIADQSDLITLTEMGRTFEDRSIPLLIIADPPIETADAAHQSEKLIVFIFANIHAGEVCGKEALLQLAREIALAEPDSTARVWLDDLIILFAPNYNADGNDRMSPDNRPGQDGPRRGMGTRANAQGLDLNRDYVKLDAPETRAMVRLLNRWEPHLIVDCHATNGSFHRYTLTYDGPLNPSGHPAPIDYLRTTLFPRVTEVVRERTGYELWYYGNFNRDRTAWLTYAAVPRYGASYHGLRGQMSILSEAYAYATYRDRVIVTREFVRAILDHAHGNHETIRALREQARRETVEAGRDPQPSDIVGIRHQLAAWPEMATVLGYVEERDARGRPQPTDEPHDYRVVHAGRFEPTLSVRRPYGYLIPPGHDAVTETLRQHGIAVEAFAGQAEVEQYTVVDAQRSNRPFQGRTQVTLDVHAERATREFAPGTTFITTAQPLGTLAVYLLEPQAEDGLAAWDFFGDAISAGEVYPVRRVIAPLDQ